MTLYPAHEAFIAPARAKPQLWRLLVGIALCLVIYVAGMAGLFGFLALFLGVSGAQTWLAEAMQAANPQTTLIILASFIGMGLGPLLVARFLHKRPMASLFGPMRRGTWDFLRAFGVSLLIFCIVTLIPSETPLTPGLSLALWASFLPLAILGLLIQTGAEEVLFRGYIQQQLAARFRSPLIWMVLPSAIFALLHYNPAQYGEHTWLVIGAIFLFAILAADLTAKTGSIGAAWGFHFANNAAGILVISLEGPLSGLALYTLPVDALESADMGGLLIADLVTTLLTWAVIRFVVTRP